MRKDGGTPAGAGMSTGDDSGSEGTCDIPIYVVVKCTWDLVSEDLH